MVCGSVSRNNINIFIDYYFEINILCYNQNTECT